jgi:hypothetical protein
VGISVERGTAAVPDDGQFHVIAEGKIVFSHKSRPRALAQYRRLRDDLTKGPHTDPKKRDVGQALRKEIAEAGARALKAASAKPRGKLRVGGRRGHR